MRSVMRPVSPAPWLAETRSVRAATSRTGGATSANPSYTTPTALTGRNANRRPSAAKCASSIGARLVIHQPAAGCAIHGAREPGANLLVGIRDDRPARRQDGEHAAPEVPDVEPVKPGALEALEGRELRGKLGSLGRRDGRAEVPEAAAEGAGRMEQDERRRQDAGEPSIRQPRQEPREERRQRRVERQEVVRIVVVEAASVLRHHRDAHVGARDGDEGHARRSRRRGGTADGAEGRERGDQVQRTQPEREADARRGAPKALRDAGHDGPAGPSEETEMGQDGLESHRRAGRRQRRSVRHAVEPVRQAADRERGSAARSAGDERAEPPAQTAGARPPGSRRGRGSWSRRRGRGSPPSRTNRTVARPPRAAGARRARSSARVPSRIVSG